MPAVFEIHLIYKNSISIEKVLDLLKKEDVSYLIDSIECMDNWEYDNHQKLKKDFIKDIDILIQKQKKIFLIEGLLNAKNRFGIYVSKGNENQYLFDFWISTEGIEQLDSNYITKENMDIYERLKTQLTIYLDAKLLVLCGIGSEVLIVEALQPKDIIAQSKNVCMWISPKEICDSEPSNYQKEIANGFFVYLLKSLEIK